MLSTTLHPAGAPSLVNGGGNVGASDLLTAPSEMLETDMSKPVLHLAQQVLSVLLATKVSWCQALLHVATLQGCQHYCTNH